MSRWNVRWPFSYHLVPLHPSHLHHVVPQMIIPRPDQQDAGSGTKREKIPENVTSKFSGSLHSSPLRCAAPTPSLQPPNPHRRAPRSRITIYTSPCRPRISCISRPPRSHFLPETWTLHPYRRPLSRPQILIR